MSRTPRWGSRDWRHRFLPFHVPLAVASALVLVAFMTLPPFNANMFPHADILSGAIPQQREQAGGVPMGHGGTKPERRVKVEAKPERWVMAGGKAEPRVMAGANRERRVMAGAKPGRWVTAGAKPRGRTRFQATPSSASHPAIYRRHRLCRHRVPRANASHWAGPTPVP